MEKLSVSKPFQKSLYSIVTNEEIITVKKEMMVERPFKSICWFVLHFLFAK